ncbi:MAG: hypothetical protein H6696_12960 [Deferribacteres bacterium]|nr:hypothetical protein [Deferribacteres bacterium]
MKSTSKSFALFIIISFIFYTCATQRGTIVNDESDVKDENITAYKEPTQKEVYGQTAPIIAFSIIGAFFGGIIGSKIDATPRAPDFSDGMQIGVFVGIIGGAIIGYFISKPDDKKDEDNSK